ncbi:MAG: metal-dependent transcriptional regulator [Synergistaceae bacterium]|jgi:Mn-dependent DtxR family transcriptional regulator|nr:metal-dependent transcriptional regulator [Synergistaceae bacterium]
MNSLTKAERNYLRAILLLSDGKRGARITDIASHLRVTKGSVCVAVAKLAKNGFVVRDTKRLILLTQDGEREANRILDSFSVINLFLKSKLKIDPHIAMEDANALVHAMSEKTVNALRSLLN